MKYCDLHCDLLNKLISLQEWTSINAKEKYQITPDDVIGGIFLQTFAVFAPNEGATFDYFSKKYRLFRQIKDFLSLQGVRAVLSVENGAFLEGRLDRIAQFSRLGVKMLTLTWNGGNALGASHGQDEGLSAFGKAAVEALSSYRILPDVSHLSDDGFFDVAKIAAFYGKPFIASHSNVRALCAHTRNLTDLQIKTLANCGGVIGVNFYPPFLGKYTPAEHIAYIIRKGGEDSAALGSDFDGIEVGFYPNCSHAVNNLEADLKKAGLTVRQIEKVLYKNALRVLDRG